VAGNVGWQRDLFLERVVIGWGWEVCVCRCEWSERGGGLSKRECSWGDTEGADYRCLRVLSFKFC
jgi:hypothetical protein